MDFFIFLGLFPLVYNLMGLFSIEMVDGNHVLTSKQTFLIVTGIATLSWMIWGFFTDYWKLFVVLLVVNNLVFSKLKNISTFFDKMSNLFTIFVIVMVFLYRLNVLVWEY